MVQMKGVLDRKPCIVADVHAGVFLAGSTKKHCSYVDVASVTCPTATKHTEHLRHAEHQDQQCHSEGAGVGVLEGVGEPAVVARVDHHHIGSVEYVQILTSAVRIVFWWRITLHNESRTCAMVF